MEQIKTEIDSILRDFNVNLKRSEDNEGSKTLTLLIPKKYKTKYDLLQQLTNKSFGKLLQEIVKKSIDKIDTTKI